MSKLKSKLVRRIMAIVLSGAMVMSNMSVYAAELAPKETIEAEETVEIEETDDAAVDSDANATDSNIDTVDDDADTADSGKKDTPQSEQTDTSEVDNKEATLNNGLEDLAIAKVENESKWKLTWTSVSVESDDSNEYETVTYKVEIKTKDAEDTAYEEVTGTLATENTSSTYEFAFGTDKESGDYTFRVTATAAKTGGQETDNLKKTNTVNYSYTKETTPDEVSAPENVTAELNTAKDGVVVSWDAVTDADSYKVTAKGQDGAADVTFDGQTDTSGQKVKATFSIGDNALVRGKSYKFSVIAVKGSKESTATETTDALAIPNDSVNPPSGDQTKTYVLTGSDLGAVAKGSKAGTTDRAGTDGYFKLNYTANSQIDSNSGERKWTQSENVVEYILPASSDTNETYRIHMDKFTSGTSPAVGFTTDAASTEVRVWWGANNNNQYVKLVDSDGKDVAGLTFTTATTKNALYYNSWILTSDNNDATTYYIVNQGGGNYLYKTEVIETRNEEKERAEWTKGTNPKISMTKKTGEDGTESTDTMAVEVSGFSLSDAGADKLVVEILKDDEVVDTKVVRTEDADDANIHEAYSFDYTATESGSYTAKATLTRRVAGEYDDTNKTATNKDDTANAKTVTSEAVTISLGLTAPENFKAEQVNKKYNVKLSWDVVNGGDGYQITVSEKDSADVLATYTIDDKSTLTYTATGYGANNETSFVAGKTYTFTIKSTSGETFSTESTTADVTIAEVATGGKTKEYILDATGWAVDTTGKVDKTETEGEIFTISYGSAGKIISMPDGMTATSWTAEHADSVAEDYAPDLTDLKGINFNGKYAASSNKLTSRYIEFTTTGTAQVKVFWSLSGDGARNLVLFKDKDTTAGNEIAKTGLTAENGKKANAYYSEFALDEAGTYELTTDANIIIYKVIVITEEPPAELEDYILDATGWAVDTTGKVDKTETEGEIFTISYGSAGKIISMPDGMTATSWTAEHADSVAEDYAPSLTDLKGINFNGKYAASSDKLTSRYIEFTTTSEAQVKVFWSLSGDGARNLVLFKDKDTTAGNEIAKTGLTVENGKKANAYYSEFALSEAGTYELTTDANIVIYKVIVSMEKATTPPGPVGPTDWIAVENPTIKAEYDDASRTGKIAVTVNAELSDITTEKVTVHMYDMSGKEVGKAQEDNTKGNEHIFTFSPTYTSRYQFDAVLSRTVKGEDGTETVLEKQSEKTPAITFTLPLATPKIIDYVNLGAVEGSDPKSGSVEISWSTVEEADGGYILTAVELNGEGNEVVDGEGNPVEVFNSGMLTDTSMTIKEGLEIGKTYRFGVTALRNYTGANGGTEESAMGTLDLAVNEKADSFEQGKYVLDAGLLYDASQTSKANLVVKTGRYSADQGAADVQPKTYIKSNGKNQDAEGNEVTNSELDAAVTATLDLLKSFEEKTYFTVMFGGSGQVNTDNRKIYPNNFVTSSRLELGNNAIAGGSVPTSDAIKFKTSAASRVDIYWRTNTAGNGVQIVDAKGKQVGSKTSDETNDTTNVGLLETSFFMDEPGTYYIGQVKGKVRITRVVVYDGYTKKERPQWTTEPVEGKDSVVAPEIISATLKEGSDSIIVVKATADIGTEASADAVTVYMTYKDENGEEQIADYKTSVTAGTEHIFEFAPESSNTYYFSAKMARDGEETTIDSVDTDAEGKDIRKSIDFKLPLANVAIKSITNKGTVEGNHGKVEAVWSKVAEAVYKIVIEDNTGTVVYEKNEKANLVTIGEKEEENSGWKEGVEGLALNAEYTFKVTAFREKAAAEDGKEPEYSESDEHSTTAVEKFTITGKDNQTWNYANFGSRANRGELSKASKTPAGCGEDSLIDTDPDSPTKGQKLADITTTAKNMKRNDYLVLKEDENGNPTKVRVWSLGTYGKIVPNSTDGVSFYYTTVDPSTYNFTLSADVHVDQWTLSNGQDGFGLAAFDQVGASPDDSNTDASYEGGDVWNNSYMAIATKTEYKWDDENKKVANTGSAVSLKLGIESIARTGVTADNISEFNNTNTVAAATNKYFKAASKPLDTQMHDKTYDNLIGNLTNPADAVTIETPITDLRLEIALNDTGYFVSYTPITVNQETREVISVGEKVTNKYYDRSALSKIDQNAVYAGFFASRNAMVTFSNIQFTQTPYDAQNANPEEKEVEYVKPNYAIVSAATSNNAEYLLTYEANWHGKLYVKDENGADISDKAASGDVRKQDASGNYYIEINGNPEETDKAELKVTLNTGNNTFQTTFEPDEEYDPYDGDPLTRLENYDARTELITVTYKKYGQEGQALYVAPLGKATGDGTKKNPIDIYTAVKYVQPGQTIYLMGESYDLSKTIRIERGTDGTKDKMIRMVPDPEEGKRPVFDFHGACEGMVIAGDYWYFYGFDVTRSADRSDGIRVCGDYNTLDSINTYKNGNTGIQISRLLGSDTNINTDWPKYNTIKNCTSYLNADPGYEDADGFACKLTSGVGNKFIGCVAAYNADDGWDLFAKVETGKIGMVTIENCITYKNGYVLRADGGKGDLAWYGEADNVTEVSAGNGNGFKMGGSSLSGYHTLKNSLAFYNKSKGFDSNSCPDVQVYNSVTFNNESYNIAFYTKGSTTDFAARGVVSYRTGNPEDLKNKDFEDRIGELTGTAPNKVSSITTTQQKGMSKIFNNTNYFFNRYSGVSENALDFVQHYTTRGVETDLTCSHDGIVADNWFVNVNFNGENGWFTKLQNESIADGTPHVIDRNANGTIKMDGFLQLTAESGMTGSGLPDLSESTADDVVSKTPADFGGVDETDGTIEKGDADDETDSAIDADDLNKKPGSAKDQVGLWFSIVNEDEIGYTGKALKPEIRVYYDNTLLTKKDYTITYKNNVNAWLGDTETGTGKTIDTATGKEPVLKDNVNAETGEVTKEEVVEGVKYTYGSGVKVAPTIIVKGKGNYIGQAKDVYFEIQPVNLGNDYQNRVSAPAITILKANQALKPVITFISKKLSDKNDYDYDSNPANLTATEKADTKLLKVTGKGNFVGKINIEVRTPENIDPNNLVSSFKIGKIDPQYRKGYVTDYTGKITQYLQVTPLTTIIDGKEAITTVNNKSIITTKDGATEVKLYDPETNPDGVIISYVNNVEVGTATAIITGTGKYYGTKEVKFKIIAPPLATLVKENNLKFIDTNKLSALVKADENTKYDKTTQKITVADISAIEFAFPTKEQPYPYMGKAVQWDELAIAAKINGEWYKLTNNTDYTLTYKGNNKVGSASVVVKGKGNYSGSINQAFTIKAFDISDMENLKYLGGTFALNEGAATAKYFEEDVTPTEENPNTVTSSTPKADAKNTINYGRMKTALYYDKTGAKPTISLRINGNLMRAGKDYTISYKNNAKVTPDNATEKQFASFTIKGKGALIGTITGTYRIEKRPFNDPENKLQITATDVKLTSKDKNSENGFAGKNNTKIVVKDANGRALSQNKDYVIDKYEYVDNSTYKVLAEKNAADPITDNKSEVRIADKNTYYTVKVTLKGAGDNYTEDTLSTYYRIAYGKNSISSAKVEIIYDGDPVNNPGLTNKYFYYKEGGTVTLSETTLKVTLKDGKDEKVLKFGTDYKVVSYSKNDRKGTAKLIIEGQGEYVEQKVINFKIGAQDFFWWIQPAVEPDQPEGTVTPQDLIHVMNECLAFAK